MGENQRLRAMQNDLADLDIELRELAEDRDRCEIPEKYQNLGHGQHGMVGSAGRLAPLHFGDEEMRRLQAAAQRGEPCRVESRAFSTADSLLPPGLFPTPVEAQHEGRVLDQLPGIAMDAPSLSFIRHTSTTGAAAPTAEGATKQEVVFNVDQLTATAVKLACHNALSYEIIADWPAFQSYCGAELYKDCRCRE